jgi:hypothetical protein
MLPGGQKPIPELAHLKAGLKAGKVPHIVLGLVGGARDAQLETLQRAW